MWLENEKKDLDKKEYNISSQATENLKDILAENDFSIKLWEYIYLQVKEKIEKNDMKYIAEGKEGVVYRIEIELPNQEKKTFLAVKRRFNNTIQKEINIQEKFFEKTVKDNTWVKVPEILWQVHTNEGKYFLMEYIPGKTLFTLKLEKIAEFFYNKFYKKYPEFFEKIKYINKDINPKNINKCNKFDFKNDTEARDWLYKIISFMNENQEWYLKKYTNIPGIILLDKKNYDDIMDKIYNDESMEIKIFEQKEWWILYDKIQNFLYQCHESGLFHKDIGWNPTNIMFIQGKENIIPVIIDFWKWEIITWEAMKKEYKKWEWPYWDEYETYIPDTDICHIIRWLSKKPPKREPRELYI